MVPTNELRFVNRQVSISESAAQNKLILQQKFVGEAGGSICLDTEDSVTFVSHVWQDVPVVEE